MKHPVLLFLLIYCLLILSCKGDDQAATGLDNAPVATTVSVSPESSEVLVDSTLQFTATVSDQNGAPMPDASVSWSVSDDVVASVSSAGLLTAQARGEVLVTATSGTAIDSAAVTSVAPPVQETTVPGGSPVVVEVGATTSVIVDPGGASASAAVAVEIDSSTAVPGTMISELIKVSIEPTAPATAQRAHSDAPQPVGLLNSYEAAIILTISASVPPAMESLWAWLTGQGPSEERYYFQPDEITPTVDSEGDPLWEVSYTLPFDAPDFFGQ